jgi:hypothetical protein
MLELEARWTVDGRAGAIIARYANHACRANAEAVLLAGGLIA